MVVDEGCLLMGLTPSRYQGTIGLVGHPMGFMEGIDLEGSLEYRRPFEIVERSWLESYVN